MTREISFTEKVLGAFKNVIKEIEKGGIDPIKVKKEIDGLEEEINELIYGIYGVKKKKNY